MSRADSIASVTKSTSPVPFRLTHRSIGDTQEMCMNVLKPASFAMLALTLWVSGEARALPTGTPALVCNSCSNPVILDRLRQQFGSYDTQYVLDFDRGAIRRFARQGKWAWQEIAVADAERNYFNLLMEFRRKNGGRLLYVDRVRLTGTIDRLGMQPLDEHAPKVSATAASDFDAVSAWEVADSGYFRNMVADYLNATRGSVWARIAGNMQMAAGSLRVLFGVDNPNDVRLGVRELAAQLEVTFRDGSRSYFNWDPYAQTFAYVPGASRDSDGNTIPDTTDDVTGGKNSYRHYQFSGTPSGVNNAIRFNRRVSWWNVMTPPPAAPALLVCTQVDSGPRICRQER
jgi:hypothetical protein